MKEEDRQRVIRLKLARFDRGPARRFGPAIPTGFDALDAALGNGLPRGSIVELFGPSCCGKTTLALQVVAHLSKSGGTAAWIDAEHVFDASYAARLGVKLADLPVVQPESAEQALDMALKLAASGAVDVMVIDSAAALVPRLELAASLGESGHGLHSRVLASGLRKLARAAANYDTAVVFLNQVRARPESGGTPGVETAETSAGGPPLKLYAAVRIALCPGGPGRVRLRVLKNKLADASNQGELRWKQEGGFAESP